MAILFKRNRLLVGYRRRDWTPVWYEPPASDSDGEDGNGGAHLFCQPMGTGPREPMEGEVCWLPQFDLKNMETNSKKEKFEMQREILSDFHGYMSTKDSDKLKEMEKGLDKPEFRRWQSIFEEAKVMKRKDVKNRQRRRTERKAVAESIENEEGFVYEVDSTSSDDSGVGDVNQSALGGRERSAMAQKRKRPSTAAEILRANDDEPMGRKPNARKPRPAAPSNSCRSRRSDPNQEEDDLFMSGGIGASDFDASDPAQRDIVMAPPAIPSRASNCLNSPPLTGGRLRGRSRTESENGLLMSARADGVGDGDDEGDNERNEKPCLRRGSLEKDDAEQGHELNRGLSEEEALDEAMRQSMEPHGGSVAPEGMVQ